MRDPHQAFRVSDDEISAWRQVLGQFPDHGRTGGRIKVDHDVPAKNYVLTRWYGIVGLEQVDPLKSDTISQLGFDPDGSCPGVHSPLKITL